MLVARGRSACSDRRSASANKKRHIVHDHFRPKPTCRLNELKAILDGPDDLEAVLEQADQRFREKRVIVCEQNSGKAH